MPLVSGHYPSIATDYLLDGKPGFLRPTLRRHDVTTDVAAALTTQVMTGAAISLQVGDVVTKIGFAVGHTAAGTPTNQFVALYSNAATPALLGQSTDTLTAAIAADTFAEYSLATPVTITATGVYIVAYMVKATTVPSLWCKAFAANSYLNTGVTFATPAVVQQPLAQTSGASLTGTAPATWASPTAGLNVPYATVR